MKLKLFIQWLIRDTEHSMNTYHEIQQIDRRLKRYSRTMLVLLLVLMITAGYLIFLLLTIHSEFHSPIF